ncbi:MAG: metallophosphoesterase family protein [Anaerolineales bacterium]|nr:metallophosphoesterase family protein [Anaerolineales bacterium]
MRILIISDIHANLTALETVLHEAGKYDAAWCLGDIVGYGPDPNECIELVCKLPKLMCVIGNHDAAALMQIDADTFNPEARNAIIWTRKTLTDSSKAFLSSLPEKIPANQVTLTHGSPRHPVWEYLLDTRTATLNFEYFDTPLCFVGHTHLPVIYSYLGNNHLAQLSIPEPNRTLVLPGRAIVNPGSVGQPRDRDPRAAYAIYDEEANTWDYHRVPYDIPSVQERMTKAGLPERHIQRLSAGW